MWCMFSHQYSCWAIRIQCKDLESRSFTSGPSMSHSIFRAWRRDHKSLFSYSQHYKAQKLSVCVSPAPAAAETPPAHCHTSAENTAPPLTAHTGHETWHKHIRFTVIHIQCLFSGSQQKCSSSCLIWSEQHQKITNTVLMEHVRVN